MVPKTRALLLVAALATVWMFSPQPAQARHQTSPDLFYNYYVPPGECGGAGAELYVSPRPVPPLVGHTWVTYQPLMPHEFMYEHCRCYVRRNPGAGLTCTKVCYCHHPLQAILPVWMDGKLCSHLFVKPFAGYGQYYHP
jgi:hypothetical protein